MKDLQEYMQDKGSKLQAIKPYIQALDKDMTMLREMRRTIQVSRMDSEQKADVLENIRRAEIALTSRIQFVKKSID
jgi:prefoldin subunit 5